MTFKVLATPSNSLENIPIDNRLPVWQLAAVFFLFLATVLLPRLGLISSGYSSADDFSAHYQSHIDSYRPLLAADLWFWQNLYGVDYLTSPLPRLMSAIWYSCALTSLLFFAVRLGCSVRDGVLLGVIGLLHPAFNELILWGILSSMPLSLFLVVLGTTLTLFAPTQLTRRFGILPLAVGSMGTQLVTSAGLVLALAAWSAARLLPPFKFVKVARLCVVSLVPPIIAVCCVLVMRYCLQIEDFASRTISIESQFTELVGAKFYVLSNAFANTYQATLGTMAPRQVVLKLFWPVFIGIPLALFAALRLWCQMLPSRALLAALLPHLVFLSALLPLMGTTATPTGFRLLGTVLCLLVLAGSIVMRAFGSSLRGQLLFAFPLVIFGLLSALATWTDLGVRSEAWERDAKWMNTVANRQKVLRAESVWICSERFRGPVPEGNGIMESYSNRTIDSYSVWYTQFLAAYVQKSGLSILTPPNALKSDRSSRHSSVALGHPNSGLWTALKPRQVLEICGVTDDS